MTAPTPDEIEARAKADYERHCAALLVNWVADGKATADAGVAEWQDPINVPEYWNAWRDDAREALIKEREDNET
jgi:hypothetical protein